MIREDQLARHEAAAPVEPLLVAASQSAAATPSPAATWLVGPAGSDPLSGVPTCPRGQGPILRVTFSPPPGDLPGTGAATAEAAFRRAYPNVTEFTSYPFGAGDHAPLWIVAGGDTYVVAYIGGPGQNSWFAHPALFVGCYTPEPRITSPGGRPSAAPTTYG